MLTSILSTLIKEIKWEFFLLRCLKLWCPWFFFMFSYKFHIKYFLFLRSLTNIFITLVSKTFIIIITRLTVKGYLIAFFICYLIPFIECFNSFYWFIVLKIENSEQISLRSFLIAFKKKCFRLSIIYKI